MGKCLFTDLRYAKHLRRGDIISSTLRPDKKCIITTRTLTFKYGAIRFPMRTVMTLSNNKFIRKIQLGLFRPKSGKRYVEGVDSMDMLLNSFETKIGY